MFFFCVVDFFFSFGLGLAFGFAFGLSSRCVKSMKGVGPVRSVMGRVSLTRRIMIILVAHIFICTGHELSRVKCNE